MSYIDHVPDDLKSWVSKLSDIEIADILTSAGRSSMVNNYYSKALPIESECKFEKNKSSSSIGIEGENEICSILNEKYSVLNTAKIGKAGDFIIDVKNKRILIEVKKYSKTVPSKEVDKFYRDVDANSSIAGGLMITISSNIVGMTKSIEHKNCFVNGKNVPLIMVNIKSLTREIAKSCIFACVDILLCKADSINKMVELDNSTIDIINVISQNVDFLSQCRLTITETQTMVNKQMSKLMQQILTAEINLKNSINNLKFSIDVIDMGEEKQLGDIKEALTMFDLDVQDYNLIQLLISRMKKGVNISNNLISDGSKNIIITILKTLIRVTIKCKLQSTLNINEKWSYDGVKLTLPLNKNTIGIVLELL